MTKRYIFCLLTLLFALGGRGQSPCAMADSLFQRQQFTEAIPFWEVCFLLDTTQGENRLRLAQSLTESGDWIRAKEHFHALDSLFPFEAGQALAQIYEAEQNLPKAIRYYRLLADMNPGNAQYLRKLGYLFQQGYDGVEARNYYSKALDINHRDVLAWLGLGESYLLDDNWESADSALTRALEIDSQKVSLLLLYSKLKYRQKDFKQVVYRLHQVEKTMDLPLVYMNMLAFALIQTGDPEKALWYLQRLLVYDPNHELNLFYTGLAHELAGRYSEALSFFERAEVAGISTSMHEYYQGQGRAYMHMNKFKSAIRVYEKSLEYKKTADVYFYMANASEQVYKDGQKAISYYENFLKNNPTDPELIRTARERIGILKEQAFMSKK